MYRDISQDLSIEIYARFIQSVYKLRVIELTVYLPYSRIQPLYPQCSKNAFSYFTISGGILHRSVYSLFSRSKVSTSRAVVTLRGFNYLPMSRVRNYP